MKKKITLILGITIMCFFYSCKNEQKEQIKAKDTNRVKIELTTIFTNDLVSMKNFFNQKMGLMITAENPNFIEFNTNGSRFSIGLRNFMFKTLKDSTYLGKRNGAAVGIGFSFSTRKDVDSLYKKMKKKNVLFIQEPTLMPWNEYTAFFKDPDGNVHELISK